MRFNSRLTLEDNRENNWKMKIPQLNKKMEQENKDDFRPLIYIVITVLATMITCLMLLSFKASAVEMSHNVNFVASWNVNSYFTIPPIGQCNVNNNNQPAFIYMPTGTNSTCADSVTLSGLSGLGFNNDYIFQIDIFMYELRDREPLNTYLNSTPTLALYYNSGLVANAQFMGWDTKNISESSGIISAYFKFNLGQQSLTNLHDLRYTSNIGIKDSEYLMAPSKITLWSKQTLSVTADFGPVIAEIRQTNEWQATINSNIQQILQQLREVNQDGGTSQLDNAEQRSEEAAQQGQDNADSSETENEQASQSVLSIIGNVIGAFGTGATDCKINADLGNLDLGNLDFCKDKPSQITNMINAFGSIIVVYACYKVAKKIFMLWIKITTYAQGGNLGGNDG